LESSMIPNWPKQKIDSRKVIGSQCSFEIVHNFSHSRVFIGNINKNIPPKKDNLAKGHRKITRFNAGVEGTHPQMLR
jgi:hypothetical protein